MAGTGRKPGRPKGSKDKRKRSYTVSEQALSQRRENFNVIPARNDEEREYNARVIEHAIRIQEIASNADKKDPVSLKSCFLAYLKLCQEDGFKVGNIGALAAMKGDRNTLSIWSRSDNPEYRELASFVRYCCALTREQLISDGKLNPVIGIFWQRNFDGLRNDTEQQQALQDENDNTVKSASDYVKQYGKLLDE